MKTGQVGVLTGKVAVITGSTRGLGREMAFAFAAAGAKVVVTSRHQDACDSLVKELTERGAESFGKACHVGRWDDLATLAEAAYERFGTVDVLVNNAGMSPLYDGVDSISEELWDKVLDVNLKGPFRLSSIVGTRMVAGKGGSIINVSSIAGVRPRRDVVPYAAAKAGVNAITQALADAFGPSVRVNALLVGPFLTDVSEAWDMEKMNTRLSNYALKRAGNPAEIIGAALFLASEASSFTTGALIPVDGGASWGGA
jgi:NAD(P)-dependent dehydrogenase (short-subunit alcohol dehydrogenase family)